MKYKSHGHCLSSKWTITPGHMGETVVWSAKMWDRALGPAMSSATRADGHWWVLHYLISLRLKKKKKEGWGREKIKAYILSAINGKRWSRIILDYYFFYLIHWCSLCHWEACQLQKQSEVIFCTGMWLAEGLCQSLSWSCQQARGKSPKKEMLTLLCVSYSTRLRWSACKRASCPIIRKQWR